MNGIPITILRNGQTEKAYLSTVRTGETGQKIRELKKKLREVKNREVKTLKQVLLITDKAEKQTDISKLDEMSVKQDELLGLSTSLAEEALDMAEELVAIALKENHGNDTNAILDCLTDRQILSCVKILETGEVPADFFPSPDTRLSVSISSPTADS